MHAPLPRQRTPLLHRHRLCGVFWTSRGSSSLHGAVARRAKKAGSPEGFLTYVSATHMHPHPHMHAAKHARNHTCTRTRAHTHTHTHAHTMHAHARTHVFCRTEMKLLNESGSVAKEGNRAKSYTMQRAPGSTERWLARVGGCCWLPLHSGWVALQLPGPGRLLAVSSSVSNENKR